MLTERARSVSSGAIRPLVLFLDRLGVSPDTVTLSGALLHVGVAWLLASGSIRLGGAVLAFAAALDALDGSLARETGRTSTFGAFLDSTLDRVSEILLFGGVALGAQVSGDDTLVTAAFVAMSGSLMVSYSRARGATVGVDTRIGLFDRLGRMLVMITALVVGLPLPGVMLVALGAWATALLRVLDVRRQLRVG